MARRKNIKTVYDSDGPWAFITKLLDDHPKLAQYAMKRIAAEIIKKAKKNIIDGRPEWAPLWRDEVGSGIYHWTPEFNAETLANGDDNPWMRRTENRSSDEPLQDTGELVRSIKLLTAGSNGNKAFASVGSTLGRAVAHEYGQENTWVDGAGNTLQDIPARPFLGPAVLAVKNSQYFKKKLRAEIKEILKEAAQNGGRIKIPNIRMP